MAFLSARLDLSQKETIRQVYEKALKDRVFRTPPGFRFLCLLREALLEGGIEAPPIPLRMRFTEIFREKAENPKERVRREERKERSMNWGAVSVLLNVVLAVLVIVLFYLSLSSPNPNILNYEKALVNKYASWETELTEREKEVRRLEREMGIKREETVDSE